ncbi:MAG: glycoside hydrolase family 127 protein [Clostridia bacterium]|nr:glycoside hydrolase family 127 protein [Clostridia bacterium]
MSVWDLYTTNQIKPLGWMRDQLAIQAEGLSGNLDKVWPDVRDSAWIGGDREGWERVPYWLDGFIPLAYLLENEDMIARSKKYIDAILAAQKPDGWICPCKDEDRASYDPWAILLITKVLTVYYDCSGDERIPAVIYRVLKNYYDMLKSGEAKLFDWGKYRWFEGFIAVNFTYDRYKEDWLLDLAKLFKEQGADYNDFVSIWERPLNWWRFETHIVNMAMMLKAEAVSHRLLGEEYTDNAEYLYGILDKYNGTPVGLFTGDECLSGLSPIQGTELCAVAEQMYTYQLLYAATGDKKWAERLEVVAFNALPATVSDDMWTHQYDQLSNQIACERFPGKPLFRTNNSEAHLFGLEPNYGCCTANFNQAWPKFALNAFMHKDGEIINAVMIPTELKDGGVSIRLETNYPFENKACYTVSADEDFTFRICIPTFAENLTVNGEKVQPGELVFNIKGGEETKICVEFETVPYFKERPHGLTTVQCGSLVFSVPVKYEKKMHEYESGGVERKFPYCDYEYVPVSDWNYAYCSDELKLQYKGVSKVPFSSEMPPVTVKASVKKIGWGLEDGFLTVCAKVPESREPISDSEEMELYPYGCAKLRMTEIPFIE